MRRYSVLSILSIALSLAAVTAYAENDKREARKHLKEGDKLFAEGEFERAVIEFERSYQLDSNHNTLFKIAESESALNNAERAIKAYKRFLNAGGNKIPKRRQKKVAQTIEELQASLDERKSNEASKKKAGLHFKKGISLKKRGALDQAVEQFEIAYDLYPNYKILYSLGGVQASLGRNDKALKAYKEYLSEGGHKVTAGKRAKVDKEIARLEEIVAKDSGKTKARAHFKEGHRFYAKAQYERAAIEYEEAYELLPTYKFLFSMGKTYVHLERNEEALSAFKQYLAEGGSDMKASRRATVENEIKRLDAIVGQAENKKESEALYKKGLGYYNDGDYDAAAKTFSKAYKLNANYMILYSYAQTKAEQKQYSKAIKSYRRYLTKGGSDIPASRRSEVEREIAKLEPLAAKETDKKQSIKVYRAGLKLRKEGKHEESAAKFDEAYSLYPNYKILYSLGKSQSKLEQTDKALETYNRYLKEGGDEIKTERRQKVEAEIARLNDIKDKEAKKEQSRRHYKQAVALRKTDNFERAAEEFETAYELYPNYKILYNLGGVYVDLNIHAKALDAYTRFLEEGGDKIPEDRRAKTNREVARLTELSTRAADKKKSRGHFKKGVQLKDLQKFDPATTELETAYKLYPSFKILYPLAQSYAGAEQNAKALKSYQKYLDKGGKKITKERETEVKAEIKRLYTSVAMIELECSIRDAHVFIDGEREGKTPVTDSIIVDAGDHKVIVRHDEKDIYEKSVSLKAGERVALQVMSDMTTGPIEVASLGDESDEEEEAEAEADAEEADSTPSDGEKPKRLWTWVAFGVGGGALIGSIITGSVAVSKKNDIEDKCPNNECPESEIASINKDIDAKKNLSLTSDILTGVAIAGAAAGTLLFFFEPKWMSNNEIAVSSAVSPDGAGLFVSGKF